MGPQLSLFGWQRCVRCPGVGGDAGVQTDPTGGGNVAGEHSGANLIELSTLIISGLIILLLGVEPSRLTRSVRGLLGEASLSCDRVLKACGSPSLGNAPYRSPDLASHQFKEADTIFPDFQMNKMKFVT